MGRTATIKKPSDGAPVPSMRIHGSVARDLGVAIVGGQYRPGETLPGEIEFSERLKISRTAYREAVRILSAKGLVESRPKTGTRVLPRERWNHLDPDVLGWAFVTEPSREFLRNLYEIRMIVEPAAAAAAAERRTDDQAAALRAALDTMTEQTLATPEGRAADKLFHEIVLQATGNEMLVSLSTSISAAIAWTTVFKQRNRGLTRDAVIDHRTLYEAIAARSPEAARTAMVDLINLALHDTELSLTH